MPPPSSPVFRIGSQLESSKVNGVTLFNTGMGLNDTVEEYLRPGVALGQDKVVNEEDAGDELDITSINDDKFESYFMSPLEIKNKTALLMKVNKKYLEEQEIKAKQEKLDREDMIKIRLDPDKK